ncbi:unnamed protein product [Spirodela intermedia]|uniref:Uncharacterized protein n=1 Tax=Spirodela intermedia TaxID=51605 RepID=A0A7I8LL65_SPIIN|nr:unnamed protein product [Spirodela intermedia]
MSFYRRLEFLESPYSVLYGEASIRRPALLPFFSSFLCEQEELLDLAIAAPLDLPRRCLPPYAPPPLAPPLSPLDLFESAADLIQIGRLQERAEAELYLRSLSDRVAALELGFHRAPPSSSAAAGDRKYTWTTEIKAPRGDGGVDRKYKLVAEAAAGGERKVKWTAELQGKDKASRTYSFQASSAPAAGEAEKKKKTKNKKIAKEKDGNEGRTRLVEISDGIDHGAAVLRQAFARRAWGEGKKKELSPRDAAVLIQMSFRDYLIRRSQVLRGLRDLAVAKAKLREIRALFSNFSYRQRIAKDAEERQRFSERIIVLLLTIEAIEGADYMVRAARRSMVDELEAILEIVDPQPPGTLGFLRRRKFDLPGGVASREIALGVAEVVQMLNDGEAAA